MHQQFNILKKMQWEVGMSTNLRNAIDQGKETNFKNAIRLHPCNIVYLADTIKLVDITHFDT